MSGLSARNRRSQIEIRPSQGGRASTPAIAAGSFGSLARWLGGSALAHAALLALVAALAVRGVAGREEVLKVSLVTVSPRPAAPVLPAATAPPAPARPMAGPRGREGAGRLGGDERPAGPPLAPPAPPTSPSHAAAFEGRRPAGNASQQEEGPAPAVIMAHPPQPSAPVEGPGPGPGATGRMESDEARPGEAAGDASGRSPAGAHVPGGAGQGGGLGRGAGRGLGATDGPGGGIAGIGPGADGAGTGPGGGGPPRPPDLADLLAQIRRRIEAAKRYPEAARREGIQGSVAVRFRVRADGQVEETEVVRSSGSRVLDEASVETIRRAAPFPPVRGWVQVPIAYTLSEADR